MNPDKTRNIISSVILIFVLLYLISLFFFSIPIENKDLVNIVLGTILGRVDNILNYYFDPVKKSRSKTNE